MFCMLTKKKYILFMFKNITREKQVIILMIPYGEKWHYLVVKKLSALLKGMTSKRYGDFCCLSSLHSFTTKKKLKSHKKACETENFCNVKMPFKNTKILLLNQSQKSGVHHFLFMQILNV